MELVSLGPRREPVSLVPLLPLTGLTGFRTSSQRSVITPATYGNEIHEPNDLSIDRYHRRSVLLLNCGAKLERDLLASNELGAITAFPLLSIAHPRWSGANVRAERLRILRLADEGRGYLSGEKTIRAGEKRFPDRRRRSSGRIWVVGCHPNGIRGREEVRARRCFCSLSVYRCTCRHAAPRAGEKGTRGKKQDSAAASFERYLSNDRWTRIAG